MLTLKKLEWNNCFSYGPNNEIEFDKNPLTQLVGTNGTGKTSIALMIQEILYGKNNKNIKKQDITNNKTGIKGYSIKLFFSKDKDEYIVDLNRQSSLKLKLFKNGKDISSHSSLNTYKTLNEITGISDFKVFCQLIYQHSTDSLDFLTATDTNRKKFLINLLQLEKYLELHEYFKEKVRIINNDISSLEGSINTIETWINKNKGLDFSKKILIKEIDPPNNEMKRISKLEEDIADINSINRKIVRNKQYKEELNQLNPKYYLNSAPVAHGKSSTELRMLINTLETQNKQYLTTISKLQKAEGRCHTCLQEIDADEVSKMLSIEKSKIAEIDYELKNIKLELDQTTNIENEIKKYTKEKTEFEKLNQLIDSSVPDKTLDLGELKTELNNLTTKVKKQQQQIEEIRLENLQISAHNSKIDVIKNQLKEMETELAEKNIELIEKENLSNVLDLLKKTFSTNGLVSYKIESSVKELERKINEYLSDLTQFQIYFKLEGEKLNINVLDDVGNITSISNLSSGERARVNIATILAIRSILSSLTATKINFLMLDEVVGVIDQEGKEKLTEILLQENLNTFIVSHDWSHPLVPRINIIKEHNISRIEND